MLDDINEAAARHDEHAALMAELEADGQWAAEMERQERQQREAEAEMDRLHRDADGTPIALPARLTPVSARCNAVPATIWPDLANVWDKPVRSVAARVAQHIAEL
jgi:hypothetical protein